MDIETFRAYCLSLPETTESLPFGDDVLVFKVCDKLFALTNLEQSPSAANLKCDPDRAIDLRDDYPEAIRAGYHMNKRHWNTVEIESEDLPEGLVAELVRHSYELVAAGLKKADRERVQAAYAQFLAAS